jgi:hypothetical protein
MINCTFAGNIAPFGWGNTLACRSYVSGDSSTVLLDNCIIADGSDWLLNDDGSIVTINCSNVDGGWNGPGQGNTSADPQFLDANGPDGTAGTMDDNLRLSPTSPCIDAGNTQLVLPDGADIDQDGNTSEATPIDLDGNPRLLDDPNSPNTGKTIFDWAVVDMGAYEFQPEGQPPVPCHPAIEGDVNCDGIVDFRDLALMSANWLETVQ